MVTRRALPIWCGATFASGPARVLLVFGYLLLGAAACLWCACLRLRSVTAFLLAGYLVAWAELVALTDVLSLAHAITRAGYLGGQLALALAALATWIACRRPRPPLRLPVETFELDPVLIALGAVVACGLAYELVVVVTTIPNNWDSMWYHLARAAAWKQEHSLAYIPNVNNQSLNAYPQNAEIGALHQFTLLGRDTYAGALQFVGQLALLATVYGIARRLGARRDAALFAALVFATLPEVALQSVTTQNDLLVAGFVAIAAFFLLDEQPTSIPLAGLAVALALGTKLTALLALPVLAVVAVAGLPRRALVRLLAWSVAAFAALSSYSFVQNIVETRNPFGNVAERTAWTPDRTVGVVVSILTRLFYRFFDLSGFQTLIDHPELVWVLVAPALTLAVAGSACIRLLREPRPELANRLGVAAIVLLTPVVVLLLAAVVGGLYKATGLPIDPRGSSLVDFSFRVNARADEDFSWFGPLGVLLVLPFAYVGLRVDSRLNRRVAALALAIPIYAICMALTIRYNQFLGRFFVAPVAVTAPLVAFVHRSRKLAAGVAAVGAATLVLTNVFNHAKPTGVTSRRPIWSATRAEAQSAQRPRMERVISAYEAVVPARANVGAVLAPDDWSYPLYGPQLRRHVVYLAPDDALQQAQRAGVRWVVYGRRRTPRDLPPGWRLIALEGGLWRLAVYQATGAAAAA